MCSTIKILKHHGDPASSVGLFREDCRPLRKRFSDGREEIYNEAGEIEKVIDSGVVYFYENGRVASELHQNGDHRFYKKGEGGAPVLERILYSTGVEGFYEDGRLNRKVFPDGKKYFYEKDIIVRKVFPSGQQQFYRKDDSLERAILPDGSENFYEKGLLVRKVFPDGQQQFYRKGDSLERVIFPSGKECFYNKDRELHREDGPAAIYPDGKEEYHMDGRLHREDGPAVIWPDGKEEYYMNGQLHREDGPAIVYPGKYYLLGKCVTSADVERRYNANRKKSALSRGNE